MCKAYFKKYYLLYIHDNYDILVFTRGNDETITLKFQLDQAVVLEGFQFVYNKVINDLVNSSH